jgi:acyl-CoA synthetase (AMP-forming)/AMP-acid ligase II
MDNLGRLLLEKFESISDAPALNDTGGTLSYRVLAGEALKVASALNRLGVSEDEPVLVPVANEARDVSALIGVWLAGGVVVPVGRHSPYAAIDGLREATGARFVITNDETERVTRVSHQEPPIRPLLEGAALIIFTSGTTGRPKGVVLSHHAFDGKLHAIDEMLNFTQKTRTLLVLQITFVFGLWMTLLTLLKGGTVWMHRRFDPAEVVTILKDKHISDVALVPTMIRKILATNESVLADSVDNIEPFRILTGGEPLGCALGRRLQMLVPQVGVVDVYGLTETCSSDFFLREKDQLKFAGTIGHPGPQVQFRIADDQGRQLPIKQIGELQIRTPFIMNGYLDEPDLTRSAFVDGFFQTGDLAQVREDGRVELAGRIKDLIMRGGAKVSPLELDHILLEHPAVAAALTTGIPDEILGERIHALIVPRADASVEEADLRDWIANRIERFKWPDVYHFVPELPTGHTGKVNRNALREQLLRES